MNRSTINHQPSTINPEGLKDISYAFSLKAIRFVNSLPQDKILLTIGDQLLRSSTSVGANIIEAKASRSEKEYIKFSEIALKSSHKAEYWLSLLKDSYKELDGDTGELIEKVRDIRALLESSLISMKRRRSD